MTPEQADTVIGLLTTMQGQLHAIEFLLTACALGVGLLWGAMSWHLIIVAKNQSTLF